MVEVVYRGNIRTCRTGEMVVVVDVIEVMVGSTVDPPPTRIMLIM